MAYRYSPAVFDRDADLHAETLYVVGGLYGNVEALHALGEMVALEPRPAHVVFNGDFHWFDVSADDFARISEGVAPHVAIRGNVETEIAGDDPSAGCGCAYPANVSDAEVARSNQILERLRTTARRFPGERGRLAALPMHRVAQVGEARIGIVHGDCTSLAGWGFAASALAAPGHARWIESGLRTARVDVFASSHTCLPATRIFEIDHGHGVIANNGAAGMPNFSGQRFGLVTRISVYPARDRLYGVMAKDVHVDTVALRYDAAAWQARFLASWPEGSPAHRSYFHRIAHGPRYELAAALPAQAGPPTAAAGGCR